MFERSSLQVIIPALDEAATIGAVVMGLRALGLYRIRVVDNGSTDDTVARARAAGAEVLVELRRGYGQACWTGTQTLSSEVDWILFCDADGSDDLGDLERLFEAASAGADFVLGDRRARAEGRAVMTPVQNFGNALSVVLIRLGWGQQYRDLGPLRLVRRTLYDAIAMQDRGFGWTIEMQVRAVELGAKIVELPVGYRRRQGGRSKISGTIKGSVQAGTIILSTIARLAWRRVPASLRWGGLFILLGAALLWPHGAQGAAAVPGMLFASAILGLGYACTWSAALRGGGSVVGPPGWWFWGVAVAARLLLLPMAPGDDVWRYLWEGQVQLAGYSPFHYPPLAPELMELRPSWWGRINHPDKTAIYPPLLQLGFRGLAATFGDTVWAWKLVFIAADLAICGLLAGRLGRGAALLFAWNPLVLYATAGGAHFESLLLLPLVLAWRTWEAGGRARAALAVGVSIGVKWISAPLLCWLAWQERARPWRALGLLALGLVPLGLALVWFRLEFGPLGSLWPGEFVAKARGMDLVPWLVDLVRRPAEISNVWIAWLFLPLAGLVLVRAQRAAGAFEGYFIVLLLCLPSVHPWYFVWLAPWAAISGHLGTRLLSLSGFLYFWVWRTQEISGVWQISAWERLTVWLPFVVGTAWWWVKRSRFSRRNAVEGGVAG